MTYFYNKKDSIQIEQTIVSSITLNLRYPAYKANLVMLRKKIAAV